MILKLARFMMHTMERSAGFLIPARHQRNHGARQMSTLQFLKITALGAGFMHAGVLLADEAAAVAAQDQLTLRPYIRISEDQTNGAFRDQVKARIRTMSQEERALMGDTGYNGRDRLTGEGTATRERTRETAREENHYGRGFESRQNQQQSAPTMSASPSGGPAMGAHPGGFGGSSRGRGR